MFAGGHIPHAGAGAHVQVERAAIEPLPEGIAGIAGKVNRLWNFHIEQIECRADINLRKQQVDDNTGGDVDTSGAAFKTE